MHMKFIKHFFAVLLCLAIFSGCMGPEISSKKSHLYLVFAPLETESTKVMVSFLQDAKGEKQDETKILVPGNSLTVAIFCDGIDPDIPVGTTYLEDEKSIQDSMAGVISTVKKMQQK
jgi:hypothetical protein